MSRPIVDRTGVRYGSLTVQSMLPRDLYTPTVWLALCDCGSERVVKSDELRSGKVRHCGDRSVHLHGSSTDLSGQRFGRLVVIERSGYVGKSVGWLCRCDCGLTKVAPATSLRSGSVSSCGCLIGEALRGRPSPMRGRLVAETPTYSGAHKRTRRVRGAANLLNCAHCGGTARAWAYDHNDPDELIGEDHGRVVHYSADPFHYLPLCDPCHRRFDQ